MEGAQIFIYRPDGTLGPFSREELQNQLSEGVIGREDFAWHQGLSEWVPVVSILPPIPSVSSRPPPAPTSNSSAERTRMKYLSHEANVRSVAFLYYLGGTFAVLLGLSYLGLFIESIVSPAPSTHGTARSTLLAADIPLCVIILVIGAIQIWLANQYRNLNRSAVVPGTIIACIGLLAFPIGTLINGLILYLIHCEKGKIVFSDRYQDVVEATPEIRYRVNIFVKIALGLLVGFLGLGVIGLILRALRGH